MEYVRKHRDIKLLKSNKRRHKFVSRTHYQTTKCLTENLVATELHQTEIKIYKLVYLGLSILDISKIAMYKY